MQDKEFTNRCYGLVIIKSENSNFNADFTGSPRRLPDEKGTIYATDKSLKYAIRKYWIDNGQTVFVWRTNKQKNGNIVPNTLEERYKNMVKKNEKPIDVFSRCIDIKLFGITFAMKAKNKEDNKNISLTGPVQISYGINKFNENIVFSSDILSPYADKKDAKNTTIGNETKGKEIYYVFDFIINPKNILNHYEDEPEIQNKMKLRKSDVLSFKEAIKYSVTNLNTSSKIGSENVFTLFITLDKDSKLQLPSMKNTVEIKKKDGKTIIDLSKINKILIDYKLTNKDVEISYNKNILNVESGNGKYSKL
jgi:CRISPR-associated protein Csh2